MLIVCVCPNMCVLACMGVCVCLYVFSMFPLSSHLQSGMKVQSNCVLVFSVYYYLKITISCPGTYGLISLSSIHHCMVNADMVKVHTVKTPKTRCSHTDLIFFPYRSLDMSPDCWYNVIAIKFTFTFGLTVCTIICICVYHVHTSCVIHFYPSMKNKW